jgi:hypothetical protein
LNSGSRSVLTSNSFIFPQLQWREKFQTFLTTLQCWFSLIFHFLALKRPSSIIIWINLRFHQMHKFHISTIFLSLTKNKTY